jgi:hypothetical protein
MSTPRSAQKQLNGEAEGDVITQDVSTAPGKEREREPLYGGEIANISESMDLDNADGGKLSELWNLVDKLTSRPIQTRYTCRDPFGRRTRTSIPFPPP